MKAYGRKDASNICQCCYCGKDAKKEISKKRARRKAKLEIKKELNNGRTKTSTS